MLSTEMIQKAVEILTKDGLVAFPTETVYGLGANAMSERAIARVFAAKARPANHPLIVHLHDASELLNWAREIPDEAILLANACWPGPLTLVLKKQPHVLKSITAGQDTVAIRVPNHPVARQLLKAFGRGLVAPSANKFTHISPTTKEAVERELGDAVELVLEGGACEVGLESTILDLTSTTPTILRPGMLSRETLSALLKKEVTHASPTSEIIAPGAHHVHYAPHTRTRLFSHSALVSASQSNKIAIITLGDWLTNHDTTIRTLSSDPAHYAHDLYHTLRELDEASYDEIWIETVPDSEAWEAIRDRITKASGVR